MFLHILALLLAIQSTPQSAPADEIKDALARAEALYYEARFNDSISLLLRANDALQPKTDRLQDKISVKQQLALSYIGMNNTAAAKALLVEIYGLDGNYSLDPRQFSPKVIALAADAKTEQAKTRCVAAGIDARKSLESANTAALLDLLRTDRPKCPELASIEPAAAELFYKKGLSEYKRSEFTEASKTLRVALQLAPGHELAAQYLELSQSKLQIMEDRILLQWQKEFESRQYAQAAADYRQMVSMREVEAAAGRAKADYRKALTGLVETFNQACPKGDWPRMGEIRSQIAEMLPDPSFGEDIRARMVPCSKTEPQPEPAQQDVPRLEIARNTKPDAGVARNTKPDAAVARNTKPDAAVARDTKPDAAIARNTKPDTGVEAKAVQTQNCLQMDVVVAMTRLKVRVEPDFPREARTFVQNSKVNLNIKARIDESGNVRVIDVQGGNPIINGPVRTAVERWKFSPAMDPSGPRCVDTDIPMTIGK